MPDQRSDQEMDNEWKPNGRPQSTMARNFSESLNSAFAIHDTTPQLEDLAQSVSQKKAAVDSQTSELQALEARIKEMDRRLEQRNSRTSSPARIREQEAGGVPRRRAPIGGVFGNDATAEASAPPAVAARKPVMANSSPLADRTANLSGEQGNVDRAAKMLAGVENASTSSHSPWMNTEDGETVIDERG